MNLQGKTALVTGASRGIGRAIALELAQTGIMRLILVARSQAQLEDVAQEISKRNFEIQVVVLPLDLTQPIEVNTAIAKTWRDYGPIHLLVNCAGVAHQKPFLQAKLPDVYQEISLNLIGLYTITRCVARRMVSQNEGTIVNVSSLMGKVAAPTMATYSATKFAILGFSNALRGELVPHNIKVVTLLPTLTDTDMIREFQRFRWVRAMTPQRVAKTLLRGLERDRTEILVGWQSHMAIWCQRFAPWLLNRILVFAMPQLA
ncbi:MAG: SDR family NAD(P)-dependent oxidoreductase [Snowella sp.]|nr:SDR family NAD(P)-dependent oxidoreductase [Snowella sp.]